MWSISVTMTRLYAELGREGLSGRVPGRARSERGSRGGVGRDWCGGGHEPGPGGRRSDPRRARPRAGLGVTRRRRMDPERLRVQAPPCQVGEEDKLRNELATPSLPRRYPPSGPRVPRSQAPHAYQLWGAVAVRAPLCSRGPAQRPSPRGPTTILGRLFVCLSANSPKASVRPSL